MHTWEGILQCTLGDQRTAFGSWFFPSVMNGDQIQVWGLGLLIEFLIFSMKFIHKCTIHTTVLQYGTTPVLQHLYYTTIREPGKGLEI